MDSSIGKNVSWRIKMNFTEERNLQRNLEGQLDKRWDREEGLWMGSWQNGHFYFWTPDEAGMRSWNRILALRTSFVNHLGLLGTLVEESLQISDSHRLQYSFLFVSESSMDLRISVHCNSSNKCITIIKTPVLEMALFLLLLIQ